MTGRRATNAASLAVLFILLVAAMNACKKSSTEPVETVPSIAGGSYVGYDDLGDGFVNVWLAVIEGETDTTSGIPSLSGFIEYGDEREQMLSITTNAAQDSLWLQYSYGGVIHRASSDISVEGLELIFSTPAGLPVLRLNREIGGSNMTGKWLGTMTSNYWQVTSSAVMIMDQWGVDFIGDVDANLYEDLHGDINAGSVAGVDFSLTGTGYYGSYSADLTFWGQYIHQDTIGGNWQIGTGSQAYDNGSFLFWRDF
ncbi:hypothetical protein KKC97_00670 [bacterium]|nr:hypothetical protein [bacterium]